LRRIEGQVRGIADMVENERCCTDVLTQVAAVHEALRGVAKKVMEDHMRTCLAEAQTDSARAVKCGELVDTISRFLR